MKDHTQHLMNMLRIMWRLKLMNNEEVIDQLNKAQLKTWQRLDQIEKILYKTVLYNGFKDKE